MNLSDASYLENGDENANHSFCSRKQTEMFLIRLLSASALSSVKYNMYGCHFSEVLKTSYQTT